MEVIDRFTRQWANCFKWVSVAALVILLCVSVIDILGSKFFNWPIPGSIDILGLTGIFIAIFGGASTQILGRHVRVDSVLTRMPRGVQRILGIITSLLSSLLLVIIIYSCTDYARRLQASNDATATLEIPLFPFVYAIVLACLPFLLVLLVELFKYILKAENK